MRVLFCESCGAPIDAPWAEIVVECRYCGCQNMPGRPGAPVPPVMPDDGRPRVHVDGRTYVIEGRMAHGDSCDVYRARWAMRLGELVVVKVLRSLPDADLVRREWSILEHLHSRGNEAGARLASRLPQPIALGSVDSRGERLVTVFGWQSGFVHTLEEVRRVHPDGVPPAVVVWLFKRLLELLGWVHASGVTHAAVLPAHVLVHPRDHGAMLVGWSTALRRKELLPALSRRWSDWYPAGVRPAAVVEPRVDVAMAARCALWAAGASQDAFAAPAGLPPQLGALLAGVAAGSADNAWTCLERLVQVSQQELGPPAYHPLSMPGWRHAGR